jgi:hypothetical protein
MENGQFTVDLILYDEQIIDCIYELIVNRNNHDAIKVITERAIQASNKFVESNGFTEAEASLGILYKNPLDGYLPFFKRIKSAAFSINNFIIEYNKYPAKLDSDNAINVLNTMIRHLNDIEYNRYLIFVRLGGDIEYLQNQIKGLAPTSLKVVSLNEELKSIHDAWRLFSGPRYSDREPVTWESK